MKNKRIFTLLSLATVGVLVSCSTSLKSNSVTRLTRAPSHYDLKEDFITNGSQVYLSENGELVKLNDPNDPKVNVLSELKMSDPVVSLYYSDAKSGAFAESKKLSATGLPKKAPLGTISWSSSNPEIATITQDGEVTAVSEGLAIITATSTSGKTATSEVYVNNTNVLASTAGKSAKHILQIQNSDNFATPSVIKVHEEYSSIKLRNNENVAESRFTQAFWASVNDAYFRIVSEDENIKTSGGTPVPSSSAYVFYTSKDYSSYIFCTSDGKANYVTLDQSSLVDKGKSQFDALGEILQSFFVAGSSIMTKQFSDILSQSSLASSSYTGSDVRYRGSFGETSGEFAYNKISTSGGRIAPEDAADWGIPSGTQVKITDDIRFVFADNLLRSKIINEKIEYKVGEDSFLEEFDVIYTYEGRGVELWWPNASEFVKVDSIFDL